MEVPWNIVLLCVRLAAHVSNGFSFAEAAVVP